MAGELPPLLLSFPGSVPAVVTIPTVLDADADDTAETVIVGGGDVHVNIHVGTAE